jgi:hypothetical protein
MAKHDGNAAIRIRNKYAALYAARLRPGPLMSRRSSRNSVASASNLGSAAGRGSGLRKTSRRFYRLCQP